jgi:hypothetical protein
MRMKFDADMGKTKELVVALTRMDGLKRGLSAAALYLKGELGEYPVQPPNVSYRRTGNLRNRWTNKASNGGLTQTIGNNAYYADDVQGSQRGNPYFKRVWGNHSIKAVSARTRSRVVDIVNNEIRRSL